MKGELIIIIIVIICIYKQQLYFYQKLTNNMNSTLVNNVIQPFNISYTILSLFISGKQVTVKTTEEQ